MDLNKEKFYKLVCTQLNLQLAELKPEASFTEDLGADSFDITELVHAVEAEYNIEIKDVDLINLTTVKDFENYIEKKVIS